MNPLFRAAADVVAFCERHGWRACVIGGVAVQRWGEPRTTRDVDITVIAGPGKEALMVDAFLGGFVARIPNARQFALEHRVLLVATNEDVPIDVSLAGVSYEDRLVGRSSVFAADTGVAIRTCSAEDLVVLKAFAGRPQDWLDVEGVIVRQGARLDRALVLQELQGLAVEGEESDALDLIAKLFRKHP